ncbi:hypothetical protein, partial [Amycolatopsis sp. NPDC051071]|uniref:hypothetical protein n=1 Tax=Amycolatopsis sp. NPDC051071 TaxID=3154637 RepID=UPI0034165288
MKAPFLYLGARKGAFVTFRIAAVVSGASAGTVVAREGLLPSAQPRKLDLHTFPKYMKAPFLYLGARKGA